MQHFPYHIRYRLYAKWKNVSYAKNPLLMVTKAETIHKSRFAIFLTHLKDIIISASDFTIDMSSDMDLKCPTRRIKLLRLAVIPPSVNPFW